MTTLTDIDAGVEPADAVPTTNASVFQFDDPSYSFSGFDGGTLEVTIVRASAFDERAIIVSAAGIDRLQDRGRSRRS